MSERPPHRRPATFKLDDPGVIVMDPDDTSRPSRGTVHVTPEADPALLPVPVEAPLVPGSAAFAGARCSGPRVGGLVAARPRARRDPPDRGPVRAQREPRLSSDWPLPPPPRWRWRSSSRAKRSDWRGWRRSKNCICAPPPCSPATIAPRAAPSSAICSGSRTRTRNWRGPAPRCRAMPTTSSTAPT